MTTLFALMLAWYGFFVPEPPSLPEKHLNEDALRTEMIQRINDLRRQGCRCGDKMLPPAPPLRWNDRLRQAAQRHAADMADHAFFNHTGTDGSSTARRVEDAGYPFRLLGENIAFNYDGLESVIDSWLNSPGHCRNLMNPAFAEMGAAVQEQYWVQTLGRSR